MADNYEKLGVKKPHLHQIVIYRPQGKANDAPFAAIVTAVGSEAIAIAYFVPGLATPFIKDGVHHLSDPRKELSNAGAWEHTPETKEYEELKERVNVLEARVCDLLDAADAAAATPAPPPSDEVARKRGPGRPKKPALVHEPLVSEPLV